MSKTKDDYDGAAMTGCIGFLWTIVVVLPMWMFLLYEILVACNVPDRAWIIFWMYLPAQLLGAVVIHLAKLMSLVRKPEAPNDV